ADFGECGEVAGLARSDSLVDAQPDEIRDGQVGGRSNEDQQAGEGDLPSVWIGQARQEPAAAPAQEPRDAGRELVDVLGRDASPAVGGRSCDGAQAVTILDSLSSYSCESRARYSAFVCISSACVPTAAT